MFKRIKILSLLQMSDKYKFKKITNKKELLVKLFLRLLIIIIVTAICAVLTMLLVDIMMIPKTVNLLVFIVLVTQILSIISCANGLLKTLYTSKDNMILLSYPARHVEVFLSKLFVFYFYELIKNLYFLFPFFLGFGIILNLVSVPFILSAIVLTIIMPLFPVLIGAIITIPIVFIQRFLKAHSGIKAVFVFLIMIGLFLLLVKLMGLLPVPLRLVALYNSFMMKLTGFIAKVNRFSLFYKNIGNILFGDKILINYLILIGVLVGLTILVALLSMPLYFKLACRTTEHSRSKKHKDVNVAHKNVFFTFVRKEWLLTTRNLGDFVNNYIFIFATPYVLFAMVTIFSSVDRNMLGEQMTIIFSGLIALLMASASNTSSAMAITIEGTEFTLIKTAPSKTSNMAWAKILFNLVISSVMIFISFLLVILLCDRITDTSSMWMIMISVILINCGLVFWSFQMDIMKPSLREYATSGSISNNVNFSRSIMIGFIISTAFTGLSLIFLLDDANLTWCWVRIIGSAVIFLGIRLYLFRNYLNAYFKEIEL